MAKVKDELRDSLDDFYKAMRAPRRSTGQAGASLVGWKPIISDALAVHPSQVAEAVENAKKKGVPTEFLPDGRPVLRTRQHRAAYLRAYGFFDRDAGYGDPANGSCKDLRGMKPSPKFTNHSECS